jgi:hypothetical protein
LELVMATTQRTRPSRSPKRLPEVAYVDQSEGAAILDRQARKYFGISGTEFIRRYRAGEIDDPDRTDVLRVAMLIPLAEQ